MTDYVLHLGVYVALFGVLALGQNLLLGLGNILFAAQAAAFGIGAYAWAILLRSAVPPEIAWILAASLATLILVPLAIPTLRLVGDYLLVASLALCEVVRSFLNNTPSLTGGAQGLTGVPLFQLGPLHFAKPSDYLMLAGTLLVVIALAFALIARSPYGRILRAIGEGAEVLIGEDSMRALGKSVRSVRIAAIAAAAASAGLAGAIYGSYITYLDPSQFTIWDSVVILAMVVLGGVGTIRGALAGATVFVLVPELLRFVHIASTGAAGPLRQVLFGLLLLLVLRYRPSGLFGRSDLAWLKA